jgi:hypothetical protein
LSYASHDYPSHCPPRYAPYPFQPSYPRTPWQSLPPGAPFSPSQDYPSHHLTYPFYNSAPNFPNQFPMQLQLPQLPPRAPPPIDLDHYQYQPHQLPGPPYNPAYQPLQPPQFTGPPVPSPAPLPPQFHFHPLGPLQRPPPPHTSTRSRPPPTPAQLVAAQEAADHAYEGIMANKWAPGLPAPAWRRLASAG